METGRKLRPKREQACDSKSVWAWEFMPFILALIKSAGYESGATVFMSLSARAQQSLGWRALVHLWIEVLEDMLLCPLCLEA